MKNGMISEGGLRISEWKKSYELRIKNKNTE